MDKVLDTLQELLKKKNRVILFIVIGFVIIVVAIIVQLIPRGNRSDQGTIDQPFDFNDDVRVVMNNIELEENNNLSRVNIYEIDQSDHSDVAQRFLNSVGKGFWRKKNYDNIYYVWSEEINPTYYLADYDNVNDAIFFRFEDAVELDEIPNISDLIASDPASAMEEIVYRYFDSEVNFETPEVTTTRNEIKLVARRLVNDIPLEVKGSEEYSDYLVFDIAGRLKEGSILLLQYSVPEKVRLFDFGYVGSAINQAAYPKDIITGYPADLDLEDLGLEPYEFSEEFSGDPPPYEFGEDELIPSKCEVTSAELVYYFVRSSTEKLSPVYKLGCRGEIELNDESYLVPVIIYANALDPEVVYVPGTLVQE